jgi:hypothetical protein
MGTATFMDSHGSEATGINNRGLIVGTSGAQAFVASNVGAPGSQPLLKLVEKSWVKIGNNWVRADLNGGSFNGAKLKLNEANWIVGYGVRYGTVYGFALKPRP